MEEGGAVAVDEVHFARNRAVLEVGCAVGFVQIIRILNALQRNPFVDGLLAALAEGDGLSARCLVVPVTCLSHGEVLQIDIVLVLVNEEHRGLLLILGNIGRWRVEKEHRRLVFADERRVLRNGGQSRRAEVVVTVAEEDVVAPLRVLLGSSQCLRQFFSIADDGLERTVGEDVALRQVLEVGGEEFVSFLLGMNVLGLIRQDITFCVRPIEELVPADGCCQKCYFRFGNKTVAFGSLRDDAAAHRQDLSGETVFGGSYRLIGAQYFNVP